MKYLLALLPIISWLMGFFKPSSDKALGKAEEVNKQQAQNLKDFKHELEIKNRPAGDFNSTVDRL